MKRSEYTAQVNLDHKNQAVRKGFQLYAWIWYHFQFWVYPVESRRPFTFFMRDWLYTHKIAFTASTIGFYGLIFWSAYWNRVFAIILCFIASMLLAHLVWGKDWCPGEQEKPEYTD